LGAFDFMERGHPCDSAAAAQVAATTVEAAVGAHHKLLLPPLAEAVEVPLSDRKHCAVATFELIEPTMATSSPPCTTLLPPPQPLAPGAAGAPCRLVVLGAHLMTKSRDKRGKVEYPGELRAFEIAAMKQLTTRFARDTGDAVLLCGDFNVNVRLNQQETEEKNAHTSTSVSTSASISACSAPAAAPAAGTGAPASSRAKAGSGSANDERFVLRGIVPHGTQPLAFAPLAFDTGYHDDDAEGGGEGGEETGGRGEAARFAWSRGDGSDLVLRDAYEGANREPFEGAIIRAAKTAAAAAAVTAGVTPSASMTTATLALPDTAAVGTAAARGSSHNASRVETIDFVWFDESRLQAVARSPLACPWPDGGPDAANPSDHIPLAVAFRLIGQLG
jgi:hypothetical protein